MIFPHKEFIIMKEVEKSRRLKDFLLENLPSLSRKEQKKLISDFASYIRKIHDNGVIHLDPNLGNFLIKQDGAKNYFYLLDLSEVKIKPSLSLKERWNNLSLLNLNFFILIPESLRYYFYKKYCEGLINKKDDILDVIREIESTTLRLAYRTWSKRIKWCLEDNEFFHKFYFGPLEVYFKKAWKGHGPLEKIISSPDDFLDGDRGNILKDGRTVKAASVDIGDGRSLFLKRYNRKGFFHTFKNIFRTSRARNVWMKSYGFELRGIPIPSPIAYIEERKFRILRRSYIINEFISGAKTLSSLFKEYLPFEERISIIQEVGREIGKMHKLGCIQGDVKWSNILIKKMGDNYKCFFVDLDGSEIKRHLSLSKIVGDLSRFYIEMIKYKITAEEQDVFLKACYRHLRLGISYETLVNKVKRCQYQPI
jgi:tRNA A-37 threonylcarbamoyl transferase component Bud32